jgi:pimeloyl-ACP methyl ester carboxylesterase
VETVSGYACIDKANLYYEIAGDGQPVILIHAGVADSRQWNNEFVDFSQDHLVLRYDLRGYGKSYPVDGEFSHMGDLIALLDKHHLDQPLVLIGCSMGGSLALDFAFEHPSLVKALVLLGSGPSGLRLDVPSHPNMDDAESAYNEGNLDLAAELEAKIWFDGMERTAQSVNKYMRMQAIDMNRLALSHDAQGLGKQLPDTEIPAVERLSDLDIPMLVVVGTQDLPYFNAAADYMVDNTPSTRKVLIEDAAHLANMEHPDQFQKIVRSFLDEISRFAVTT